MSLNSCFACSPPLPHRRVILASLRKQLIKINLDYQPDFREENETQILNDLAFSRLIDIISTDDSTLHPSANKCSHHRFLRYLRRKLKCNSQTLNDLCNQLILTIAERNYQLTVLTMQIKSAYCTSQLIAIDPKHSQLVKLELQRREEEVESNTKQSLTYKQHRVQKESAQQINPHLQDNPQGNASPTSKLQSN